MCAAWFSSFLLKPFVSLVKRRLNQFLGQDDLDESTDRYQELLERLARAVGAPGQLPAPVARERPQANGAAPTLASLPRRVPASPNPRRVERRRASSRGLCTGTP